MLEMVDLARWGKRASLFLLVARLSAEDPEDGAVIAYRQAADAICTEQRYVQKLFRWLRAERVLMLIERGSGRRPHRWRINPNVRGWRGVPWLVSPELAAFRVREATRPSRARISAVVPRSHSAALAPVVPRSHGAALRLVVPRYSNAALGTRSAALRDRGTTDFGADDDTYSLEVSSKPLSREQSSGVAQVIQVIEARTGCDVFGRLVDDVAQLVADHGADRVEIEAEGIDPTGLKAPAFVAALRRTLRGPAADAGGPARRPAARARDAEIASLRAKLDAMRAIDASQTDIDDLAARLAALEADQSGPTTSPMGSVAEGPVW